MNPSEEGRRFFHEIKTNPQQKAEFLEPLIAYFMQQEAGVPREEACADLVYLVNKHRVSLKNCWFINMDEYLDDELKYLPKTDPLSFRGGMDRIFYGLIDEELNIPEEQRIFPEPGAEHKVWDLIQKFGKLDMCWGGVGITGHIAFNEPPEPGEECTDEEFLARPTRVLQLARETKTINAFMNCGANIEAIPANCITVGMKEIMMAKKMTSTSTKPPQRPMAPPARRLTVRMMGQSRLRTWTAS